MSLTNTHNDYLDPDRHLNHPEDYGFDRVKAALSARDTGRGHGDCSWTGKDADLDAGGEQGLTLESVDDEYAVATVYISASFAGTDVCLNLPAWAEEDDETFDQVREIWLDAAESVVSGCSVAGEWTGDDWCMHESFTVRVKTVLNDDDDTDAEATAEALIKAAQEVVADAEAELVLAHQMMEQLAGWRTYHVDGTSTRHPEGEPCEGSVWSIFQSQN
jgi:hypothetical protein